MKEDIVVEEEDVFIPDKEMAIMNEVVVELTEEEMLIGTDTPSCFGCGRFFESWQGLNVHSRHCSEI